MSVFDCLNLRIRTTVTLGQLPLPIIVKIEDIKHAGETFIDYKVSIDGEDVIYDHTNNFYEKNKSLSLVKNKIKEIWEYVDLDMCDKRTIVGILEIEDYEDFEELCLHTDFCTLDEIYKMSNEISFYKEKMKKMFAKSCIELFELEREFPKIKLEDDKMSSYINKYSDFFRYSDAMYSLQLVSEFPMDAWFPENKGKAFMDWSWRELESKRLYLAMKNTTEGFRETVKAKAMEETREK